MKSLKKKVMALMAACVVMLSSTLAYAATVTLYKPVKSVTTTASTSTTSFAVKMMRSEAGYLEVKITPEYSSRGSVTLYKDTTKSVATSGKDTKLEDIIKYTSIVPNYKSYQKVTVVNTSKATANGTVYTFTRSYSY